MLVTISYGVSVGVPAAWLSVLNYSLKELGIHQVWNYLLLLNDFVVYFDEKDNYMSIDLIQVD